MREGKQQEERRQAEEEEEDVLLWMSLNVQRTWGSLASVTSHTHIHARTHTLVCNLS